MPYFGAAFHFVLRNHADLRRAGDGARTRDIKLGRLALYQLSYSRDIPPRSTASAADGGGRTRTFEGLRRQIYSLIPLATWVPHPIVSRAGAARATSDLAELTARIELATARLQIGCSAN